MAEIHEHDAMTCRACGREERASEGYPCSTCGTFMGEGVRADLQIGCATRIR